MDAEVFRDKLKERGDEVDAKEAFIDELKKNFIDKLRRVFKDELRSSYEGTSQLVFKYEGSARD